MRDHGFIAYITAAARRHGVSAYVGDGSAAWSAVHRSDAARLVRLGLEQAPAGSCLHAVAEEGVPTREIAEAIGHVLDVPVTSVAPEDAEEHFGFIGRFFALDMSASSTSTRELLGWDPSGPDPARRHQGRRLQRRDEVSLAYESSPIWMRCRFNFSKMGASPNWNRSSAPESESSPSASERIDSGCQDGTTNRSPRPTDQR